MAPLPIKLMSLAGSLVILMVFATYFVMPIYYKLADEGDTIGTDFGVNNSLTINNSRELYTQDSLNDHFWVVGVSFAFLALLIIYFHSHGDTGQRRVIRRTERIQ